MFTVTFKDWNGSTLKTETVTDGGNATAPTNPSRDGFTFTGWDKAFSNITTNLDVTAQYQAKPSSGNGSSGGGGASVVSPSQTPENSTIAETKASTQGSVSTATVTADCMNKAINAAFTKALQEKSNATVTLSVDAPKESKKVNAEIPGDSLKKLADATTNVSLTVTTSIASITFDNTALETIGAIAKGNATTISVAQVDKTTLSKRQQALVGNRPVIDLSIQADGKSISNFKGTATVSIPYAPAPGEDTRNLIVWYLADNGSLVPMHCTYADGKLTFQTTHFSTYVLASVPYKDMVFDEWFYQAAVYVYGRGLMSGTATDKFDPQATTTRGMLVSILYRNALQPAVSGNLAFGDVPADAYYVKAVDWATQQGILKGVSDERFAPEDAVTREQLVTILYRNAKSPAVETVDMSKYPDAGEISAYASSAFKWAIKSGIIKGDVNGMLNPKGHATRAEVATLLMNYFSIEP